MGEWADKRVGGRAASAYQVRNLCFHFTNCEMVCPPWSSLLFFLLIIALNLFNCGRVGRNIITPYSLLKMQYKYFNYQSVPPCPSAFKFFSKSQREGGDRLVNGRPVPPLCFRFFFTIFLLDVAFWFWHLRLWFVFALYVCNFFVSQPASHPASQPASQPARKPASQRPSQPARQPVKDAAMQQPIGKHRDGRRSRAPLAQWLVSCVYGAEVPGSIPSARTSNH